MEKSVKETDSFNKTFYSMELLGWYIKFVTCIFITECLAMTNSVLQLATVPFRLADNISGIFSLQIVVMCLYSDHFYSNGNQWQWLELIFFHSRVFLMKLHHSRVECNIIKSRREHELSLMVIWMMSCILPAALNLMLQLAHWTQDTEHKLANRNSPRQ